jgi:hypothetical protein
MPTFTRALPLSFVLGIAGCDAEPAAIDPATPPVAASPAAVTAPAPAVFAMVSVTLYQPENVVAQRLRGADELATFLKAVERTVAASLPADSPPRELDVVIAIKPGREARFWFVQVPDGDAIPAQLERDLQALNVPQVVGGPVAVALIGSVSGAPASSTASSAPMPQQWRDAAAKSTGRVALPEGVLATLWPD